MDTRGLAWLASRLLALWLMVQGLAGASSIVYVLSLDTFRTAIGLVLLPPLVTLLAGWALWVGVPRLVPTLITEGPGGVASDAGVPTLVPLLLALLGVWSIAAAIPECATTVAQLIAARDPGSLLGRSALTGDQMRTWQAGVRGELVGSVLRAGLGVLLVVRATDLADVILRWQRAPSAPTDRSHAD